MKKIYIFLVLPIWVFAYLDPFVVEEQDPFICHHVNVMTGHLSFYVEDAVAVGAKPIALTRTYSSLGALERSPNNMDLILRGIRGGWMLQGGWNFIAHIPLM